MAYYGNLALQPERKTEQTTQPARQRETVTRRRQLPVGEKLLYLFTVVVCAIVAGLIIYRYAEIYQMNRQLQEINRKHESTIVQMKEMQREVERLKNPQRIREQGAKQGMIQIDPNKGISVGDNGNAVAMNVKK